MTEAGRNFVYNGFLRRSARRVLAGRKTTMNVSVVGGDPADSALFANIAAVALRSVEAGRISEFDEAWMAASDIIIAGVDHAGALRQLVERQPGAKNLILSIAIRAPIGALDADALAAINGLCEAFQLELVAIQTAPLDFCRDTEMLVILTRPQSAIESNGMALLKSAVILEAFALRSAAIEKIRAYNRTVSDESDAIDEAMIDRDYEVLPFPMEEFTSTTQAGDLSPAPGTTTETDSAAAPFLSIHFDLFHREDGPQRLASLVKNLARPELAEILVRVPSLETRDLNNAMHSRPGPKIKFIVDPRPARGANPSSPLFLAETANTAQVVAYFGAETVPVEIGWDYDLSRMMKAVEGRVFAFKHSRHKTRYIVSPQDALNYVEGFPVVSRAWLEICGAWSIANVPPAQFQSLVAFYFDHIDWMNKHRFMQLIPVMTVQTQPIDPDAAEGKTYVLSKSEHDQALQMALRLFARETSFRAGLDEFHSTYEYRRGVLTMKLSEPTPTVRTFKLRPPKSRYPF